MSDWAVWPIFLVQLLAILAVFAKRHARLFGLSYKVIGMIIILLCNIAIIISLIHDASSPLNLYF